MILVPIKFIKSLKIENTVISDSYNYSSDFSILSDVLVRFIDLFGFKLIGNQILSGLIFAFQLLSELWQIDIQFEFFGFNKDVKCYLGGDWDF